jgi:hypothetical protein
MTMTGQDFSAIAERLLVGVLGDYDAAAATAPLLSQLLADAFDLGSKVTQVPDWAGALFGPPAAGGATWASRLADSLAEAMPDDMLQNATSWFSGAPVSVPPSPRPAGPPEQAPRELLAALIKRLGTMPGPGPAEVLPALTSLKELNDEIWQLGAGALPPGGRWSPENVVRSVRALILKWLKILGDIKLPNHPSLRKVIEEIEAELAGPWERRVAMASGLSFGGVLLYGTRDLQDLLRTKSFKELGVQVHQELQQEYRQAGARRRNVIVQESIVYVGGVGQPLSRIWGQNPDLQALYLSRDVYLVKIRDLLAKSRSALAQEVEQSLRDDNLDLTLGRVWEIKPIRGAWFGVAQEFGYRSFFNIYAALIQDDPALFGSRSLVRPGGPWPTRHHVDSGTGPEWPELQNDNGVRTIGGGGTRFPAQTILLVTIDVLPGLVLYLRFDLPALVVAAMARYLARLLNDLAKELKRIVDDVVVVVVFAMILVVALVVVAALVYFVVEAAAAAVAELATLLAALGIELAQQIADLLRRLVDQIAPLREAFGLSVRGIDSSGDGKVCLRFRLADSTPEDAVPCASATFGILRLENAPVQVLMAMPGLLAAASELTASLIQRRLGNLPAT